MGRLSGRIVSIRQNQGPPIKKSRQYGTKVKSGQSEGKEIGFFSSKKKKVGQSSFMNLKI